jgi:ubiquinone/menaquinone biosynthesis C-methylase UbiE
VSGVEPQRSAASAKYAGGAWEKNWRFNYSDPVFRFLRHRRLNIALGILRERRLLNPASQSVLVVCGGAGEEGILLRDVGFSDITISDISTEALAICTKTNPDFATAVANAEDMQGFSDESYDIVVVQDGLHHLPRPVQGFTEMLRVARVAAVVIEPHHGFVGNLLGTTWEKERGAVNYVFRWDRMLLEQATYSYLVRDDVVVVRRRLWDHALAMSRVVYTLPKRFRLPAAHTLYGILAPLGFAGNMMVGVVVKPAGRP